MEKSEISPALKSHEFWKSSVGSELTLEMITPPESQLSCMKISVYTISHPPVFKVAAYYTSGENDLIFCNEHEARNIVKNEWMKYYSNRTRVTFVKHNVVDMGPLLNYRPAFDSR